MSPASTPEVLTMADLREWRERLGISQERVARHIGCSSRTLGRWENGATDPGELVRRSIAKVYADAEQRPEVYAA